MRPSNAFESGKIEIIGNPGKVGNEYIYQNMSDEDRRIIQEEIRGREKAEKELRERAKKEEETKKLNEEEAEKLKLEQERKQQAREEKKQEENIQGIPIKRKIAEVEKVLLYNQKRKKEKCFQNWR